MSVDDCKRNLAVHGEKTVTLQRELDAERTPRATVVTLTISRRAFAIRSPSCCESKEERTTHPLKFTTLYVELEQRKDQIGLN